jgi:hypothetical protein
MKKVVFIPLAAATVGVVLGVGHAYSNDPAAPRLAAPDPAAEESLVAGPDGEALKCNGKLMKVKVNTIPSLTPAAVKAARQQGKLEDQGVKVARCETKSGKETGRVKWVSETR